MMVATGAELLKAHHDAHYGERVPARHSEPNSLPKRPGDKWKKWLASRAKSQPEDQDNLDDLPFSPFHQPPVGRLRVFSNDKSSSATTAPTSDSEKNLDEDDEVDSTYDETAAFETAAVRSMDDQPAALRSMEVPFETDALPCMDDPMFGLGKLGGPSLVYDTFLDENEKQSKQSLRHASAEECANREVVLKAIAKEVLDLKYAAQALLADHDFMLEAVSRTRQALRYASEQMRSDPEFMIAAVRNAHAPALQYASQELKSDSDFMLRAVVVDTKAVDYASEELLQDGHFAEQVLTTCEFPGNAVQKVLPGLQNLPDTTLNKLAKSIRNSHTLMKVTLMSGNSCIYAASPRDTAYAVMLRAGLMLVGRPLTGQVLLAGQNHLIGCTAQVCDWVGIQVGRLNQVQIVVRAPNEQNDQ